MNIRSQIASAGLAVVALAILLPSIAASALKEEAANANSSPVSLTVLVMDPLSAPLACDCVQGYAQRKYESLGQYLQRSLKKPVQVVWSESIRRATKEHGTPHIIIGKHSVVQYKAKQAKQPVRPVAQLSGLDGKVTQTGLIVVRKDDAAQSVSDLKGYRIFFGPEDCEEKHAAVMQYLKTSGIEIPAELEVSGACSEAAAELMELDANVNAAAVISSYAKPLLSGCGTIKEGDLRVIGESQPVPFITAFVSAALPKKDKQAIRTALLDVELEPRVMIALESAEGFRRWSNPKQIKQKADKKQKQKTTAVKTKAAILASTKSAVGDATASNPAPTNWTQWRGSGQDGETAWLPATLPDPFVETWSAEVAGDGVGGICANDDVVIVSGRDLLDQHDVFQCFEQKTGELRWQHLYAASGNLDYGNSPRATPFLFDDVVYTLGAFGDLCCVDLETGIPYWQKNIAKEFKSHELVWGHSVSPIVVNDQLIVQPGGSRGFLAALDLDTGETIWKSGASEGGYSGMVVVSNAEGSQIVTYDSASLGGWSLKDGQRLWTLVPPEKGDFNVPTVVVKGNRLLAATENNGTRWYSLDETGTPKSQPTAQNGDLAPDCHSPVISGGRVFGIWNELYALNEVTLETEWSSDDDAFAGYASLISSPNRLLCLTEEGEVLLIATDGDAPQIVSRHQLTPKTTRFLSHPAIADKAVYIRVDRTVKKFNLNAE